MTALADIGPKAGPRLRAPRLIEIVLVLSLGLNLFVAGGFAYSRWEGTTRHDAPPAAPERRLDAIARRLDIDPDDAKSFKELKRSFRTAQSTFIAQNRPLAGEIWEELAKLQPEDAEIQGLLDQMAAHRRAFQAATTTALERFLATLTPAQRSDFIKLMEDRTDPIGGPLRNNIGN
jgi:Spy/CpxP family protein refolding chaperone